MVHSQLYLDTDGVEKMRGQVLLRVIGGLFFGLIGWAIGEHLQSGGSFPGGVHWALPLGLAGAVGGAAAIPYLTIVPMRWLQREIRQLPTQSFAMVVLGLMLALLAAALLALPLSMLPGIFGKVMPLAIAILLCYVSAMAMLMRGREILSLAGLATGGKLGAPRHRHEVIVDTSAIIDGRIADVSQSGFVSGPLIIPRFVLNELQHIADSSDPLRRKRGRRGLEMLNRLQKETNVPIEIVDIDFEDVEGVDSKLISLGSKLGYPILTNDFNLNRVADLQGVQVLNVNQLATALKPVVLPGEEMEIRIIQEGKELGQGVGFLDDGTMVVVEGGRRFLNTTISVVVTRVLQTAVGRMIFAQLRNGASHERGQ